jgi:hypothetical protein
VPYQVEVTRYLYQIVAGYKRPSMYEISRYSHEVLVETAPECRPLEAGEPRENTVSASVYSKSPRPAGKPATPREEPRACVGRSPC